MASTASDLIKFEKQATGENADTWGTKANTAMSRLEEATAGYTAITMVGANYTLDDTQYVENTTTTAESHLAMIKVNGTPGASYKVVVPLRTKIYMIWNNVTTYDITVGGATGGVITVPNGKIMKVFCDGTNVEALTPAIDSDGIIAQVIGKHAVPIPAVGMYTATTSGAAEGAVETTTNAVMIKTWDFDTSADEYVQFQVPMPKSWNESTVTFKAYWSHAATTTNFGVSWGLQGLSLGDSDAIDAAFGTGVVVDDTGGTTDDIFISPESTAVTIAGTPAEGDIVIFRLYRDVSDANDDMAIDARLHGITLYITTTAGNDA